MKSKINREGLVSHLKETDDLTEVEVAIVCTWLIEKSEGAYPKIQELCQFIESGGIRHNINRSRLQLKLVKDRRVSAPKGQQIRINAAANSELNSRYANYLQWAKPDTPDSLLILSDFGTDRKYIQSLAQQVNDSYQFQIFDGCAVLMRRLAEVLIIDAYDRANRDSEIRDASGNFLMLNGLLNALNSGTAFKLSRNGPKSLNDLKLLGDTAAHSRNYITKKRDIDDLSQRFRMLIEELKSLS